MGAWGAGSFENDTALDFSAEITSLAVVLETIQSVLQSEDDCMDADFSSQALVACECIAAMMGNPAADLPDEPGERIRSIGRPTMQQRDSARDCVSKLLRCSELVDLWAEENPAEFNLAMTSLIERLNPDLKQSAAAPGSKSAPQTAGHCAFCNEPVPYDEALSINHSRLADAGEGITRGFWCHLTCLNKAQHPRHIVQDWKFDPEEINREAMRLLGRDE